MSDRLMDDSDLEIAEDGGYELGWNEAIEAAAEIAYARAKKSYGRAGWDEYVLGAPSLEAACQKEAAYIDRAIRKLKKP